MLAPRGRGSLDGGAGFCYNFHITHQKSQGGGVNAYLALSLIRKENLDDENECAGGFRSCMRNSSEC